MTEEPLPDEAEKRLDERRREDLRDVIKIILASPLKKDGTVSYADGNISLQQLSKQNTNVMTRIIMSAADSAARGDVKSAELLFKYGGYEPVKEQNITVNTPKLIDDMTCRAEPVVSAIIEDDEEEDEDEDEA
jgi:hypothetical protein